MATILSADERRAETVRVVVELAAEQNPTDITTANIANRMGLTQGALFRHFPSKQAIIQAVLEWASVQMLSRLTKAAESAATPEAALQAIFTAHLSFAVKHPGVPRIFVSEMQRPEETLTKRLAREYFLRYRTLLESRIDAGKACGDFDPSIDTASAALVFLGTIQGLLFQSLISGDAKLKEFNTADVFKVFLQGIRGQR